MNNKMNVYDIFKKMEVVDKCYSNITRAYTINKKYN